MKCPVCQIGLPISLSDGDYHDCDNCGSSLHIKEGGVEVLQEAESPIQDSVTMSKEELEKNEGFREEEVEKSEITKVPTLDIDEDLLEEEAEEKKEDAFWVEEKEEEQEGKPEAEEDFEEEEELIKEEEEDIEEGEGFEDVKEFATKEQGSEGAFHYSLHLKEINSEDLRGKVQRLLEEEFLGLELEVEIENGEIKLDKISPVTTYLIVNSLMGLPIHMEWSQKSSLD